MRVGILGTGTVGQALTTGLAAAGHDPVVGEVLTHREAADSDAVILAVPASAVVDVVTNVQDALADTPVIDATNEYPSPTGADPVAVRVADAVPGAHVVKAFNTIGANRMTAPVVDGVPATMFLAGDDAASLDTTATLAADMGFEPVVAGGLSAASHLEHLARFWIHLSRDHGRDIGFRLLRES